MRHDIANATDFLSRYHKPFDNPELRRHAATILSASVDPATVVEQRSAREGDARPALLNPDDVMLYNQLVLQAIRNARRERVQNRYTSDVELFLSNFVGEFLPDLDPLKIYRDTAEGEFIEYAAGGANRAHVAGLVLDGLEGLNSGMQALGRRADLQEAIRYWTFQGCLQARGNSLDAAYELMRRLQRVAEGLNAHSRWLRRHPDHPDFVSPHGEIRMPGADNGNHRRGGRPVRGASRVGGAVRRRGSEGNE